MHSNALAMAFENELQEGFTLDEIFAPAKVRIIDHKMRERESPWGAE